MRNVKLLAMLAASVAVLSACTSTPLKTDDKPAVADHSAPPTASNPRDVNTVQAPTVDELNAPGGKLAKRSVYFDYDSYAVRDDGKDVVQNHSTYLGKNKARKVLIQGNTDERGGTEYNLALGQKRAEAVRKAMAALGVSESQMEAVSLGKEKPKAQGSNEAAWAENRRADIVY
ncbi:MAG: peptidoglycan-associated lipoprotein Pal [Pseudomonadota bacterium]